MVNIGLLVTGILVGVVAFYLFPGQLLGMFSNLGLGILGAVIGAYVILAIGTPTEVWETEFFSALGGAICAVFGGNFAYILVNHGGESLNRTVFHEEKPRRRRLPRLRLKRSRH